MSEKFAKKFNVGDIPDQGRSMEIQGVSKDKIMTTCRASMKIMLEWERVYIFDMWIMDHCAGVNVLLGTDFLIPAENTKDEVGVLYEESGPVTTTDIPSREWRTFRLSIRQPTPKTHEIWIRRTEKLNSDCHEVLEKKTRPSATYEYIRKDSILFCTYAGYSLGPDRTTATRCRGRQQMKLLKIRLEKKVVTKNHLNKTPEMSLSILNAPLSQSVLITEGNDEKDDETSNPCIHEGADIDLTDYAQELAFLPDLSENSPTVLDYSDPNVTNSKLTEQDETKLIEVLKTHEKIMIASGNALCGEVGETFAPWPYGVVCDIDVNGNSPIKRRASRNSISYLKKLYELLKGLLKANL
ncbi:LOW QUALITY PROTEIN: hypothetical protein PHMEG_000912 [Phytophthora megakarya]|uniref:Uncharacterized protein n=1 Tax=Phytophthora megakarya TaxID=4795 RepID=A0A225X358_9STRA|nr:LOW QUALITY PROTEIN: hypothetical protein PHMEG_000912 [Phytophthora megakarya]